MEVPCRHLEVRDALLVLVLVVIFRRGERAK